MDEQPSDPQFPQISNHNNGTLSMFLESTALIATTILLIVAIIVLIVVNTSHSAPKAKLSTTTTGSQTTTPPPANNQNQVAAWQTANGSELSALEADINSTNVQVSDQSYSGLETACQQLGTDVATDQSTPGIPNSTAANDYSNGLSQLSSAAQSCVAGSQIYLNPADNSQPKVELQAGADLTTFTADLKTGTTDIQNTITAIAGATN